MFPNYTHVVSAQVSNETGYPPTFGEFYTLIGVDMSVTEVTSVVKSQVSPRQFDQWGSYLQIMRNIEGLSQWQLITRPLPQNAPPFVIAGGNKYLIKGINQRFCHDRQIVQHCIQLEIFKK